MLKIGHFLEKIKRVNTVLLVSAILLAVIGVLFVRSACSIRTGELHFLYVKHIRFAILGFLGLLGMTFTNYRKIMKLTPLVYLGSFFLLVAVLLFGEEQMGARRWLFGLQPSEPAKIATVMFLAFLLGNFREKLQGIKGFCICCLVMLVPVGLILLQPDLGTALVLVPTLFAMLFVSNIAPRTFWTVVVLGACLAAYVLGMIYFANTAHVSDETRVAMKKATFLRPHQVERVEVFLFPDRKIHDEGYNARQSEIAVGSGGLTGKGYMKGDQNALGYLPAVVSVNDFIFPVLAEETGFVGSVLLLMLFVGGVFIPGIIIGARCVDDTGKLLCVGITTLMFFHMFINIAMTVRLVPITGIPLPFISYGGTFMLTMMFAVGIVQSVAVHGRKQEHVFKR